MPIRTPNLQVTIDRVAEVVKSVDDMTTQMVCVGIPSSTVGRRPDPDEKIPITNAVIGYVQETGDPAKNLPARPFLVPGVQSIQREVIDRLRAAASLALAGKRDAVNKSLNAIGMLGQNAVRKKIAEGPFAPLSPVTLEARKARGRRGTRPLIDTGQLRNAITYVIRRRLRYAQSLRGNIEANK